MTTPKAKKRTSTRSAPRPRPTRDPEIPRGVVKVDQLPPPRRTGPNSRTLRYQTKLAEIRKGAKVGEPCILARFKGPGGAGLVRRRILAGETPVDGKVSDWEFDARRVDDGSVLYATRRR